MRPVLAGQSLPRRRTSQVRRASPVDATRLTLTIAPTTVKTQMTGTGRPSARPVGTANHISMIATPKTASHGMSALVSHVLDLGLIEATTIQQLDAFAAGIQFARAEGILPAPESNHAIAAAINEALRAKEEGKQRTILFNLSGHGNFDMQSYMDYQAGKLENYDYPAEAIAKALDGLPPVQ